MTQRHDADELLRKLAAVSGVPGEAGWLHLILSTIDDAVLGTDARGAVRYMNRAAERLSGRVLANLDGRPLEDALELLDERTRLPVDCPSLQAPAGELQVRTVVLRRPGRDELLLELKAVTLEPTPDGARGMVLVLRDITEQRHGEAAEVRLAAIVASSEDAIISKTLDGVITTWNAAAERLFGYTAAEAVGKSITLIIPPELLDEETYILGRLRAGERIEHFETVRQTKYGRRLDISLSISPVKDKSGRIVGVSKIARDITEQKRAQADLKEADRRKDEFIALLSHELRNPLAPIGNGLQFMKLLPSNTGDVAQVRDMMERQLRHLVRLVDDLLDVSRISQNRLQLRRARVTLAEVVEHAVETARPMIDAAEHLLTVSLPPEPVYLDADMTRLSQVVSNLLSNSAKYTDRGGRIALTGALVDGEVAISVADNGIGIPREDLPRVFDMFAQVERAISRSSGGLGIGLSLVKGIVEMHGGSVTANSDGPGKGSTFTVRLPAASEPACATA